MDLLDILNASESSDDEYSTGVTPSFMNNYTPGLRIEQSESVHVDLEQILNEDDSSDDSDDNIGIKFSKISHLKSDLHNFRSSPEKILSVDYDDWRQAPVTKSMNHVGKVDQYSTTHDKFDADENDLNTSHNAEDWAVLQAILHEDDDDEDFSTAEATTLPPMPSFHTTMLRKEKLAPTIQSVGGTSSGIDASQDTAMYHVSNSQYSSSVSQWEPKNDTRNDFSGNFNETNSDGKPRLSPSISNSLLPTPSGTHYNNRKDFIVHDNKDQLTEAASKRAFEHSQNTERRLLRSGHREIVSPLMVKRRLKPRIELSSRPVLHKQKSALKKPLPPKSTVSRLRSIPLAVGPRFNFSGIVDKKSMSGVTKQIVKHANAKLAKVYCGLPTCLAFNSKFIAVGTQKGIILVFDLFEVLRQRLGASIHDENWSGGKISGSITSIDLSHNGEAVAAGYTTGAIVLWDTIRGVVLRSVSDIHISAITSVRFLNDLKMVTVDAGGLVNKLSFTKNLLWSNYNVEPECLLDGTAGQILAMNVLLPYSTVKITARSTTFNKVLSKLMLMALSSERSSFVVAVDPKVNVLHRWARPPPDRTDELNNTEESRSDRVFVPSLSWGWALISGGGNVVMPILARAWGCCLQLLCASFPTMDENDTPNPGDEPLIHWPAFGVHDEIDATVPIVAIDWLNDRTLVYLTVSNELTLVDTVMMTLLERLDFSGISLVYAEFALSRSARKDGSSETSSVSSMVFQNSTRCSDDRLLVLCQDQLVCISIVGARRRISALEVDGEWLEALAFALDHYENTVLSQEDRRRDPNSRRDLSRHPEFSAAKSEEEEWIANLLMRYLNLAVENAPESSLSETNRQYSMDGTHRIDLAQSHYQMLCGVACEFCLSIRRIDLLYGPIFRRFQSVGYTNVFLDVLEPYVLNDKLSYIAPEVMSLFVEHCKATSGISTVERCLLHMDCTIMDFDSILTLLKRNEMYTALFYVYNEGLDDYVTPLELLLEKVFDESDAGGSLMKSHQDGILCSDFERFGYKALVYLQTCFKGLTFPQEKNLEPEDRQRSVKVQLLTFLIKKNYSPTQREPKHVKQTGLRSSKFPYARLLLSLDPWCTLDTLALALTYVDELPCEQSNIDYEWVDGSEKNERIETMVSSKQIVLDIFSHVLLPVTSDDLQSEQVTSQSKGAVNAFLDFTCTYLMQGVVKADKFTTYSVLKRKSELFAANTDVAGRKQTQSQILALMSALPRDSYDPDKVLEIFEKSSMHRAALVIHQQIASSRHDVELQTSHFMSAIDCHLVDDDISFRKEVFQYVTNECTGIIDGGEHQEVVRAISLRDALLSKMSPLVHLDSFLTARLAADLFPEELDRVINVLDSNDGGEGQYLFLQALISNEAGNDDPGVGPSVNISIVHHQNYLALMAKLHPELVYEYLSTHDSYDNEESLRLCRHYDIADASAYLLERMGNVSSALQLILQTLESRLMGLKRVVRGLGIDSIRHQPNHRFGSALSKSIPLPRKQENDLEGVKRILVVALDLCERNSEIFSVACEDKSKFSHGELWFNVLDRLINAKGFLRLAKEQQEHAKVMGLVLSDLLRLTMHRMVSSVPLKALVRKVTSDHSASRIGELREMVECLLATYSFEVKLFQSAVAAFHHDVQDMRRNQFDLQIKGDGVPAVEKASSGYVSSHGYHVDKLDGSLLVGSKCSSFTIADRVQVAKKLDTGLDQALLKLRNRREQKAGRMNTPRRFGDLNMMTMTEKMHQTNDMEHVVYDRFSGVLGEAEHHGRLIMFQ